MLKEVVEAANRVRMPLVKTKAFTEDALLSGAELVTEIVNFRRSRKLQMSVCANALCQVAAGNAATAEGLRHYTEAHASLAQIRDRIGLREHMAGDWWPTEDPIQAPTEGATPLRVVA